MYRGLVAVAVLIVLAILLFSSVYTVTEQERAVVTTFGEARGIRGPGIHFRIPIVQRVHRVNTTIRGMEFGFETTRGGYRQIEEESLMITSDINFVNIDFYVQWQVVDPVRYRFAAVDPETILRNVLQAEARSVVASYEIIDVLTVARAEIQVVVLENVSARLDSTYDIGILVRSIAILDASPPTQEVRDAFKAVETAQQYHFTQIQEAWAYHDTVIPHARALADGIVQEAEAEKEARIREAEGQVSRFLAMYAEYRNNPEITRTRIYLETLEVVFPQLRIIADGGGDLFRFLDVAPNVNTNPNPGTAGSEQ